MQKGAKAPFFYSPDYRIPGCPMESAAHQLSRQFRYGRASAARKQGRALPLMVNSQGRWAVIQHFLARVQLVEHSVRVHNFYF